MPMPDHMPAQDLNPPQVLTSAQARALAGLILGVVAIGMEGLVISPLLNDIARDFATDPAHTAWAVAVYGLALASVAPPVGLWSGRLPRRTVMAAGLCIFVLAGLLCAVAPNFTVLLVARALCGVGAGLFLPSCYAHVGDSVPYAQRGRVMGKVMAGWSLALILGVPLGSVAGDLWGWRCTFLLVSALGSVALALVLRLPATEPACTPGPSLLQEATLILRQGLPRLLAVNFFDMVSFYGVYTFLGSAVRDRMGVGSGLFGLLVLCYGAGLLFSTTNARIVDRLGKERSATVTLGLLVLVLSLLPFATRSFAGLAACMLVWGVLQGLTQTALATLLTQVGGRARSFATACMSCTTYLAVAVGAGGGGALLKVVGFSGLAWAGGGCALIACLLLRRTVVADVATTSP